MRSIVAGLAGVLVLLLLATPAGALITRLTALQDMLAEATVTVVVKVESLDEKRPAMMLVVEETLKGKPEWKKLPVLLKGDARATKLKEQPQLLKRLVAGQKLVLFVSKLESDYAAFAYTEGTWFSLSATMVEKEVRGQFTHLEPYLRRTYKGTTAEMIALIKDVLAGKRKPPAPNDKEKPGLGPEVKPTRKESARALVQPLQYGVIPTVLVGGPLALLAMLFPAVFGGWKRWLALLSTAGTNCMLVTLQWWFAQSLAGSWWGTPTALWTTMNICNVLGLGWAWRRHLRRVQLGEAPLLAGGVELVVLLIVSLIGVGTLVVCKMLDQPIFSPIWLPAVVFIFAVWFGTAYVVWTRLRGARLVPALATETVVLTGLVLASVTLAPALPGRVTAGGLETGEQTSAQPTSIDLVWTFRLPEKGAIASSPLVHGDRVFVAAAHDNVFRPYGALYCLDRASGRVVWTFHDGRKMKQVFSSPTIADQKLYIGEGFHQDYECKVYCLDPATGKKLWEFQAGSHTESSASIVGDRVYIGAGDDGVYCLSAQTGDRIWNFPGFHVDATPTANERRVLVGCGIGDSYKTTAIFCLDARTGQPQWRMHTTLPVWSRPLVSHGHVHVGTGNGRLNESADRPAGEVLCLRESNGEEVWKKKFPDGVLGRLAIDQERLYFGCRDGFFYALSRKNGEMAWRRDLGSPVVSGPAFQVCSCCEAPGDRLYVASLAGLLVCLEPRTGKLLWSKDLVDRTKVPIELISTPALEVRGATRRLYIAMTLVSAARTGELHCYEERGVE
jgi:outer membrane protein assembly factor BamB